MADTLQNGRFVLLGPLGQGTQGRTFDAVDKREGRPVAVKRFDVRTARTWKDAELAEREARVLQSLSHHRLPRYVDYFEQDGALYLVMEKIEGESLANVRKRGVTGTEKEVLRLLRDASDVLDYLHRRTPPIVHRDLKPGNVVRRPDGSFAFVDFGAVRDKLRPEGGSTVIGTFGYMAPEQFQGRALPASDVYAIGATALAFMTGQEPENLPHRGLAIDVRAALGGRASAPLVHALERMLDPDPDKRAARIGDLLADLQRDDRQRARAESDWGRWGTNEPWESLWHKIPEGLERQAREFEKRADELEQLASRGGAASEGWRRGAEGWRRGADKWHEAARKIAQRQARRAERRAQREARRAMRRNASGADRDPARDLGRTARDPSAADRDDWRSRRWGRAPWPIRLALTIAFAVAIVAVSIVTQVVIPLVLTALSWFFAPRGLTAARSQVRAAGRQAVREIVQTRRDFRRTADSARQASDANAPDSPSRVRVDSSARVRVANPPPDEREPRDATEPESSSAETDATRKRGPL